MTLIIPRILINKKKVQQKFTSLRKKIHLNYRDHQKELTNFSFLRFYCVNSNTSMVIIAFENKMLSVYIVSVRLNSQITNKCGRSSSTNYTNRIESLKKKQKESEKPTDHFASHIIVSSSCCRVYFFVLFFLIVWIVAHLRG